MKRSFRFVLGLMGLCIHGLNHAAEIELAVHSVTDEQRANLIAFLNIATETCDSPRWRVQRQWKKADADVRKALEPLGFFNARIANRSLKRNDNCWHASLTMDIGRPTIIQSVALSVNLPEQYRDEMINEIAAVQDLQGQSYHASRYESAKTQLAVRAIEQGYLDAVYQTQRVDVFPDQARAEVVLQLDVGRRYQINDRRIIQSENSLDHQFIENLIALDEDAVASTDEINRIRTRLVNSGYFDDVDVRYMQKEAADGKVPVEIRLVPVARYTYSAGLGYSTDTDGRVRFGTDFPRLGKLGRKFSAKALLSGIESEITASYHLPSVQRPDRRWFTLEAGYRKEDTETTDSESIRVGWSKHRQLGSGWRTAVYVDALSESFDLGKLRDRSNLLIPGTLWQKTLTPGITYPLNGYRISMEMKAASDSILSDVSLLSMSAKGKLLYGLSDSSRLIFRGELGVLLSSDFDQVPLSLRFFAGGDQSIRGYDYKEIGSLNASGEVIGGDRLLTASVEWDFKLDNQWGGAVFVDVGDAFEDSLELRRGVGAGLRWYSPLGPVRLDVAHPLDSDTSVRVHVSVGADL